MARIIEYNEGEYGESRGGSGSGAAALVVVVIVIMLYLSGNLPWFTSASTAYDQRGLATVSPGITLPAGNISYVTAERLNMREAPGSYSLVTYILPRGTRVTMLGNTYQDPSGELWIQVRIETYEGLQTGWVNRQYIA